MINVIRTLTESVLDEPRDSLNPQIWASEKLKPEVRTFLLDKIKEFNIEGIKRITFQGSNTGYQYNDITDIDIHIWVPGVTPEKIEEYKNTLPRDIFLPGTKIPIQFYVTEADETSEEYSGKGSMYDIEKDEWIRGPEKSKITKVPYDYLMSLAKFFVEGIENRIREYETDNKELEHLMKRQPDEEGYEERIKQKKIDINSDIDALRTASYILWYYRADSFNGVPSDTELQMGSGNESVQNAVYKIVEELGTKKKMNDILEAEKRERSKGRSVI